VDKKIKQRGTTITQKEHEKWHKENHEMTPEMHGALLKEMGISDEEDREWHRKQGMLQRSSRKLERRPVNPFALGGGFLAYCVRQGWLIREGKGRNTKYYMTEEGKEQIGKMRIKV